MRKLTKTFYLFINYITYAVGINKFDKDANSWYSGSYNVEESQEYSHTVEYVSQSVRYPHKHLSKHLPFSAGLHNNTISVDLLVTPDKSNTVIFGENKSYVSKPAYLNTSNVLKPLFVLGDRTSNLSKVNIQNIDINYNNYLKTLELINDELFTFGDGPYINYYLPNIQTNNVNFFFWSNVTLEDPSVVNYNFVSRGSFFDVKDQFDSVDLTCLGMDINEKNTNSLSYLPSLVVDVANKLSLFKEKHNKYLSDWYDSQDFSWSTQFIYTNFYIPFKVSRKIRKHSFFYRYLLINYIVNPIIGKGWLSMIKADTFLLKHLFTFLKK